MKIKCVIIDDEALAISVIEDHLKNFDNIEVVATYTNPLKAFGLLEKEKIDVIFLDINMPQIKSNGNNKKVVHQYINSRSAVGKS